MPLNRDFILRKLGKNKSKDQESSIYRIHHQLMKTYGWIPLEEFLKLPQQTVNDLIKEINKDTEAEKKEAAKLKNKSRKK